LKDCILQSSSDIIPGSWLFVSRIASGGPLFCKKAGQKTFDKLIKNFCGVQGQFL